MILLLSLSIPYSSDKGQVCIHIIIIIIINIIMITIIGIPLRVPNDIWEVSSAIARSFV